MIVNIENGADLSKIQSELAGLGCWVGPVHISASGHRALLLKPYSAPVSAEDVRNIPGVESVLVAVSEHARMDSQMLPLTVAGVDFGTGTPVVMAGPCSVESEDQIYQAARRVAGCGAQFLRGGAYKPRTSPYSFQGHGAPGLRWLQGAATAFGLRTVTELLTPEQADLVACYADLIQIGSRNMQNMSLLRAAGQTGKPVLLKRGAAATLQEWLLAGEAALLAGAQTVLLCERGVRGFDPTTRNLLDLGTVAHLASLGLGIIVDPSHATGRRDLVLPLAQAGLAAGACGLLVETHDQPQTALSDGPQALTPHQFAQLMGSLALFGNRTRQSRSVDTEVAWGGVQ
ncbi:MAG: 3-deoxy-7-phosphoheptulonate synthase [Myxococcales bacterium]|nr:3-deoxy-7-phosphoheptulonate synthase [Myxococcales bacterium]